MATRCPHAAMSLLLLFFLGVGPAVRAQSSMIAAQDLVINELMFDPVVGGAEYVEIYNRSDRPLSVVSLSLTLRDAEGHPGKYYSLAAIDALIPPKGYLVCTKKRAQLLQEFPLSDSSVIYEIKMPALKNEGASVLLLRSADQLVIDEVHYLPQWHDPLLKKRKGVSLERIDPEGASSDAGSWSSSLASAGYGTPGYANSLLLSEREDATVWIELPQYLPERSVYRLVYSTDKVGYRCRIMLFTMDGVKVATIANNQRLGLSGELEWDGCSLDGRPLPSGLYLFYGEIFHAEGVVKRMKRPFPMRAR